MKTSRAVLPGKSLRGFPHSQDAVNIPIFQKLMDNLLGPQNLVLRGLIPVYTVEASDLLDRPPRRGPLLCN
jgi:hypothetical protein